MRSTQVSPTGGYAYARTQSAGDRVQVEQLLAVARVAMCLSCVAGAWLGPAATPFHFTFVRALLLGYTGLSLLLLAFFTYAPPAELRIERAVHCADFAWASAVNLLTSGASPFFALFLFCLLSAGFRWRLRETLITGAGAILVTAVPTLLGHGELDLFVVRSTFTAISAVLVGLLAENEKGRREQLAMIGDMLAGVQAQSGFRLALKYVASVMMRMTGSETFLVAARELDTNRAVLWTASWARSGATLLA